MNISKDSLTFKAHQLILLITLFFPLNITNIISLYIISKL